MCVCHMCFLHSRVVGRDVSYERREVTVSFRMRSDQSRARITVRGFYLTERFGYDVLGHAKLTLWVQSPSMTVRLEG